MPVMMGAVVNIIVDRPAGVVGKLWTNALIIAVLLAQNIPMHTLFVRFMSSVIRSIEAMLRQALVRRLQELSIAFHDRFESGRLQSKILRDVEAVEGLAQQLINTVFFALVTMLFALVFTIRKDILVAFFFLVTVPVSVTLVHLFRGRGAAERGPLLGHAAGEHRLWS